MLYFTLIQSYVIFDLDTIVSDIFDPNIIISYLFNLIQSSHMCVTSSNHSVVMLDLETIIT